MFEAMGEALQNIFGCPCSFGPLPDRLLFLFLGALMGLFLGAIPGLGGLVGLAILLPLTMELDGLSAILTAIGMLSTLNTSDTVPAVLFAVPGTNASQATILDGHPMARKGEAKRALGAAYMSSAMGGVFGALVLAVSIPLLRPLVLLFGSAEFFMLGLLGISMVAVLSGPAPRRGLIVAFFGLAIGMIGPDPQTGIHRWVFDQLYLFDGVDLVPIALGLFAIPELVDLSLRGTRIAEGVPGDSMRNAGMLQGIRDAVRHWFLVVRCSLIGVWVGAVPGLGGSVVDWLAYGHAYQTSKGSADTFGKGDVRGVIAPESANNAREGGALVPTIAFGIPGTGAMALLLSIFIVHGIQPGRAMVTTNVATSYTLVWSLALANILGTVVLMGLGNVLAKVANFPIRVLSPVILAVVFMAALQTTGNFGDVVVLMIAGVVGWVMKRAGWPRPPFILAFILSPIVENYFFRSMSLYGLTWLTRPIVIVLGLVIVVVIVSNWIKIRRGNRRARTLEDLEAEQRSGA